MFNRKQYNHEYRIKNKERIIQKEKEYWQNHLEARRAKGKRYYQKHRKQVDKKNKKWAQNHKKRMVEIVLKSREKNREKFDKYQYKRNHSLKGRQALKKYNQSIHGKYQLYKNQHRRKKYDGEFITEPEFKEIVESSCIYCGENEKSRGIDRVDNSKGYIKENSAPCCRICNYMKKAMSKQEFMNHISKIYKYNLVKFFRPCP